MSGLLQMSARFQLTPTDLILVYEVANQSPRDAYLLNRLYRTEPKWDMSPHVIYVHLDHKTETIWLNKKLPDLPAGARITAPVAPFVTPLRAGASFREEVKVPLPVREYRQYSLDSEEDEEDEPVLVPRPYRQVYFTLGYYRRPEGTVEKTQDVHGTEVVLPQTPSGVPLEFGELHTDRKRLDIPVLVPPDAGK
jgi:hypothetical protein